VKLTKNQKARIADFLRGQDGNFGKLSANARVQALAMLKTRIRQELFALQLDEVDDEQVESILDRMIVSVNPKSDAPPTEETETPAAEETETPATESVNLSKDVVLTPGPEPGPEPVDSYLTIEPPEWKADSVEAPVKSPEPDATPARPEPEPVVEPVAVEPRKVEKKKSLKKTAARKKEIPPAPAKPVATPEAIDEEVTVTVDADGAVDFGERRWLGVCSAMAPRFGLPVKSMRIAFIVAGCLTGPFSLVGYLACYFVDVQRNSGAYLPADGRIASWRMVRALIIAVALYVCAWVILFGAGWVFTEYLGRIAELNQLGWFMTNDRLLLNVVLLATLPMAMLSGLPLAGDWDRTMGLLVNTVLALYAVVLGLGVSSALAGYFLAALG
jgi:phage shock protein PspC (stress-responsive transcriptional regulator)